LPGSRHNWPTGSPIADPQTCGQPALKLIGADGRPTGDPVLNLDSDAFLLAVKGFAEAAREAEIASLYSAGHGMQIARHPTLLPVDVPDTDSDLIRR